jgi:hypothetical protein
VGHLSAVLFDDQQTMAVAGGCYGAKVFRIDPR